MKKLFCAIGMLGFALSACSYDPPPKGVEYRYRNGDLIRVVGDPTHCYENSTHGKGP